MIYINQEGKGLMNLPVYVNELMPSLSGEIDYLKAPRQNSLRRPSIAHNYSGKKKKDSQLVYLMVD